MRMRGGIGGEIGREGFRLDDRLRVVEVIWVWHTLL